MDLHVDLSILEEIISRPEAVEEGGQDIKPITSDSAQRESGRQDNWSVRNEGDRTQ